MRLELGCVQVNDIQFASESKVENGTVYVNAKELRILLLEDENLRSVELEIAKPGKNVRIMPIRDVIEPRVKVDGGGNLFPGVISKVETVGSGRTNILKGSAVITTGKIVGFQESIIDMCDEGAKYAPLSQLNNLVAVCGPIDGLAKYAHEEVVRFTGLKAADYIGKLAKDVEPNEVKVYGTCSIKEGIEKYLELPRVAYVLVLQSQGLMHDTYVYGIDIKQSLPIILNPTELVGGAALSGNYVSVCDKNTTYHHLNNPVIADLFEQHGRILNFAGVIVTNENIYLADRMRSSDWMSKLYEFLDADGAIVSQEGFGSPNTDLIMNCKKTGAKGVKTVIIMDEYAGRDGAFQPSADAGASANAIVTGGNTNMVINLPAMDKVIGYPGAVDIITDEFDRSLQKDGSVVAELQVITGATNEMGFNKLSAR